MRESGATQAISASTKNDAYSAFLATKRINVEPAGFDLPISQISKKLFPFQRAIVQWALRRGRAIIGCDTGLGKSIMAMEWASRIGGHSLILAPLAVALQFVGEGKKHGYEVRYVRTPEEMSPHADGVIHVTNYERFRAFDSVPLRSLVVDECSILASFDGETRTHIIERSQSIPFRLGCSATPAPNDFIELGNHAQFLGIMTWQEMAATFFVHDGMSGGDSRNASWRLKGHAEDAFWRWVVSWMVFVKRPSDIGFEDERFRLPKLTIEDHLIESDYKPEGMLFATKLSGIQDRTKVRRSTIEDRVSKAVKLIKGNDEQWIAWCGLNDEAEGVASKIKDSRNLSGDDDPEEKAKAIIEFTEGKFRVLVTKAKIAGMGLNLQNCAHQVFVGLGDSYKDYYQCIRRSWRYGQKRPVNVHIVLSEIEAEIAANVRRKERDADHMSSEMVKRMSDLEKQEIKGATKAEIAYQTQTQKGRDWRLEQGDCVEVLKKEPDNSVDLSVYSPPFAALYVYSNSHHDMGNAKDVGQFFRQFDFFLKELYRVTKPGCLSCCHVSQLSAMLSRDGYIGLKDFRGWCIEAFLKAGWIQHGEVAIDKNPQAQAIRTKAKGLLFATKNKDSRQLRPALADFVLIFRKEGEAAPVKTDVSNEEWITFAHPVWTDIRETETLSAIEGREEKDEKHICPLQLEVIERCIRLYSNKGETVLDPFNGIGSTGYEAIKHGRKYLGIELKTSYFNAAVRNIQEAEHKANAVSLFADQKEAI